MIAPRVRRVLETSLYVDDVGRAVEFYRRVIRLEVMHAEDRFAAMDAGEGSVLLLFLRGATTEAADTDEGRIPPHDGVGPVHLAFAIDADTLDGWRQHLAAERVEIESEVNWNRGGVSLYFRDPDGHAVELATPGLWRNY